MQSTPARLRLCLLLGATVLVAAATPSTPEANTNEERCLALNIYFEARGTPIPDQQAVGAVTLNRVYSGKYKPDVCGTVYQRNKRGAQFSWTIDPHPNVPKDLKAYGQAKKIANDLLTGKRIDNTKGATYYYDHRRTSPPWRHKMEVTYRTGYHTFLSYQGDPKRPWPTLASPTLDVLVDKIILLANPPAPEPPPNFRA